MTNPISGGKIPWIGVIRVAKVQGWLVWRAWKALSRLVFRRVNFRFKPWHQPANSETPDCEVCRPKSNQPQGSRLKTWWGLKLEVGVHQIPNYWRERIVWVHSYLVLVSVS